MPPLPEPRPRQFRDHHLANRIKAGKTNTQFQATAGADGVVFHLILKGIAGSEADMIIGEGIAKGDCPLPACCMIARCDQHEPIFGKREGFQFFGGVDLVADDADLGDVSSDGAHNLAAGTLLQINVDLGLLRQECGQGSRKELGGCSRIGEETHAPPKAVGIL